MNKEYIDEEIFDLEETETSEDAILDVEEEDKFESLMGGL